MKQFIGPAFASVALSLAVLWSAGALADPTRKAAPAEERPPQAVPAKAKEAGTGGRGSCEEEEYLPGCPKTNAFSEGPRFLRAKAYVGEWLNGYKAPSLTEPWIAACLPIMTGLADAAFVIAFGGDPKVRPVTNFGRCLVANRLLLFPATDQAKANRALLASFPEEERQHALRLLLQARPYDLVSEKADATDFRQTLEVVRQLDDHERISPVLQRAPFEKSWRGHGWSSGGRVFSKHAYRALADAANAYLTLAVDSGLLAKVPEYVWENVEGMIRGAAYAESTTPSADFARIFFLTTFAPEANDPNRSQGERK
jgi:hypothetical protein